MILFAITIDMCFAFAADCCVIVMLSKTALNLIVVQGGLVLLVVLQVAFLLVQQAT